MKQRIPSMNRRAFVRAASAATAGGIVLASPLGKLYAQRKEGRGGQKDSPYGPITPVLDGTTGLPLLSLPPGFQYFSMGWTGDLMSDGTLTPDRHDGMAVVYADGPGGKRLHLIRNHERGASDPTNPLPLIGMGSAPVYDGFALPGAISGLGGGTTALVLDRGRLVSSQATLAGTLTNCAGGPTPWGSWLTCEETTIRGSLIGAKDHGYVYEVPAPLLGRASAVPIKDMGFMDHEAVAIDPSSGYAYLTEDNGPYSGFYRYRPTSRARGLGALEQGGELEMLKVVGVPNADLRRPSLGDSYAVTWVPVEDPDLDPESLVPPDVGFPPIEGAGRSGPYLQGEALGGARFNRGEGCWYYRDVIYFVDTSGGGAGEGAVWAYQPPGNERGFGELTAIYTSPGAEEANNPDNITLSPDGGILLCEDGGAVLDSDGSLTYGARLIGIDDWGRAYTFAENSMLLESEIPDKPLIAPGDYRGSEFAGATFDPRGQWLFVNIQSPGVTFAIKGPFARGPLR